MIAVLRNYFQDLGRWALAMWNQFWFTPSDPATLCLIRILAGAMLFYTHLVWSLRLEAFFLPSGFISPAAALAAQMDYYAWSYLWLIDSRAVLWIVHLATLAVFAMLTLGLFTRVTSVLSFVAAISYANRVPGAVFGLDQINVMLAMYLMIGPAGDCYSLDRWLAVRRAGQPLPQANPSISANIAIRLIQIHMCVIYFFAGLSKLQGETWWNGWAMWGAVANLEYQSIDMTWLAGWPLLIALSTHITVFWELTFCVLVWVPKLRPIVVALAVPLHMSIALCMGMMTFGLIMLVGCMSFVSPRLVRMILDQKEEQPTENPGRPWSASKPGHLKRQQTARSGKAS